MSTSRKKRTPLDPSQSSSMLPKTTSPARLGNLSAKQLTTLHPPPGGKSNQATTTNRVKLYTPKAPLTQPVATTYRVYRCPQTNCFRASAQALPNIPSDADLDLRPLMHSPTGILFRKLVYYQVHASPLSIAEVYTRI